MMTDAHWLSVALGMVAGYSLGYIQAWRFAMKLEAHGVRLKHWDRPMEESPRGVRNGQEENQSNSEAA